MNFLDLLGQSHAIKTGQMLISRTPKGGGVLISGPQGCGKGSYAKILANGLGGEGGHYNTFPDPIYGEWSIIRPIMSSRSEWGALADLMDAHPRHTFIVIVPSLDEVPGGIQSRCVRVQLVAIPESDLLHYAEADLVAHQVPFCKEALTAAVQRCKGSIRELQNLLGLAKTAGTLDAAFLDSLIPSLIPMADKFFSLMVEGYYPEAVELTKEAFSLNTPMAFAKELLNRYGRAFDTPHPLGSQIKKHFPNVLKTYEVLHKWVTIPLPPQPEVAPLLVEQLKVTGIPVEDPRLKAARLEAEQKRMDEVSPLGALDLSSRENPHLPIHADLSTAMDPRVRRELQARAEQEQKEAQAAFSPRVPSCARKAPTEAQPHGLHPAKRATRPKGSVVKSEFAKKFRATPLTVEQKWDIRNQERQERDATFAAVSAALEEVGAGGIVSETEGRLTLQVPKDHLQTFLDMGAKVCY